MPDCLRTAAISQGQRRSFASFQRRRTLGQWLCFSKIASGLDRVVRLNHRMIGGDACNPALARNVRIKALLFRQQRPPRGSMRFLAYPRGRWHVGNRHLLSFGGYPLFFGQSELDALLSEQPAKKRPFPSAKMPELVAALHKLDDLPNRAAQHQPVSNMPEFREFRITNARFREAARQAPRGPGRKSRR
jgi:hypothetical protein